MIINMKQAASIVKENYKGTSPIRVIDYNNEKYVIEAPKTKNEPDFGMPFYYVTKDGKDYGRFNPIEDLDIFIERSEKAYIIK